MFRALRNELYRTFSGKKIYILSSLMIFLALAVAYIMKRISDQSDSGTVLLNAQAYPIQFFTMIGSIFLPILIIIQICGLISDDYRDGTLKQTLLAPVTRLELLLAKFLTVFVSNIFFLTVTLLAAYLAGVLFAGWDTGFVYEGHSLDTTGGIQANLKLFALVLLPATTFGTLILLFSLFLRNSGMVVGLSVIIYIFQIAFQSLAPNLGPYLLVTYFRIGYGFLSPDISKMLFSMFVFCGIHLGATLLAAFINLKARDILH